MTTSILDVKIKEAQGARQVINISNLAEEIDLQIPFESLTPVSAPDVFFKQSDNESIQYHTFEVEDTNEAIEFNVKPVEKQEQLTILVKYGKKPTLSDHDLQVKLPNFSSCSFPVNLTFKDDNCTENPFSIFLPSTYLNKVGTYYIGVKYEGTPGNQSGTQSRQRRDCGGGGRSKRSLECIEYKDPPPTQPSNGKFAQGQQSYDKSKHSNYTIESLGLGCNYWNPSGNQFSGGGCRVRLNVNSAICDIFKNKLEKITEIFGHFFQFSNFHAGILPHHTTTHHTTPHDTMPRHATASHTASHHTKSHQTLIK